jgi:hypothetical protein
MFRDTDLVLAAPFAARNLPPVLVGEQAQPFLHLVMLVMMFSLLDLLRAQATANINSSK